MGCAERHFPVAAVSGERRVSGLGAPGGGGAAGGGVGSRLGPTRRRGPPGLQRSHPSAATARCPLTSGGECGDPGRHGGNPVRRRRRVPGDTAGSSCLSRTGGPPGACFGRPWGPQAGLQLHTKPAGTAEGPLVQPPTSWGKTTHLRPLHPSPPPPAEPPPQPAHSLAAGPHTSQARVALPPFWDRFAPSSSWEPRSHPFPALCRASFRGPHPADRCVLGTLNEPPGICRLCSPSCQRGSWRGFSYHRLGLPRLGRQNRRPVPQASPGPRLWVWGRHG